MITREQALQLTYRDEIHFGTCKKNVGPRGGVTYKVETWRVNGKVKTWKTRLSDFEVPIKFGMRAYDYLSEYNAKDFHLAAECPIGDLDLVCKACGRSLPICVCQPVETQ